MIIIIIFILDLAAPVLFVIYYQGRLNRSTRMSAFPFKPDPTQKKGVTFVSPYKSMDSYMVF